MLKDQQIDERYEWYTPKVYIDSVYKVLGHIDLDPASSMLANNTVGALSYYTIDDDGLDQDWYGKVWMVPPFSPGMSSKFCMKLAEHVREGDITEAIVLVRNATDTGWFHEVAALSSAMVLHRKRIKFVSPIGNYEKSLISMFGQVFIYIGTKQNIFLNEFSQFGYGCKTYR